MNVEQDERTDTSKRIGTAFLVATVCSAGVAHLGYPVLGGGIAAIGLATAGMLFVHEDTTVLE